MGNGIKSIPPLEVYIDTFCFIFNSKLTARGLSGGGAPAGGRAARIYCGRPSRGFVWFLMNFYGFIPRPPRGITASGRGGSGALAPRIPGGAFIKPRLPLIRFQYVFTRRRVVRDTNDDDDDDGIIVITRFTYASFCFLHYIYIIGF